MQYNQYIQVIKLHIYIIIQAVIELWENCPILMFSTCINILFLSIAYEGIHTCMYIKYITIVFVFTNCTTNNNIIITIK